MGSGRLNRKLLAAIIGLLGLCVIGGLYATHGVVWSIYVPIYGRILDSIPSPPGVLPSTGWTKLIPSYPCGQKGYRVGPTQGALGDFFADRLTQIGWELTFHYDDYEKVAGTDGQYRRYHHLVLVNRERYWLSIVSTVYEDAQGNQVIPSSVEMMVCTDQEWKALH